MPVNRKARAWKELLLGISMFLIGLLFAMQWPADPLLCRKVISEGIETNGTVVARETRRSARTRRGRITRFVREEFSVIAYDGYEGVANFWPETDAVPVIYLRNDHDSVLVGRKSEGFLALYNRNFRWGFVIFSAFMALVLVPFGAGIVGTGSWYLWSQSRDRDRSR